MHGRGRGGRMKPSLPTRVTNHKTSRSMLKRVCARHGGLLTSLAHLVPSGHRYACHQECERTCSHQRPRTCRSTGNTQAPHEQFPFLASGQGTTTTNTALQPAGQNSKYRVRGSGQVPNVGGTHLYIRPSTPEGSGTKTPSFASLLSEFIDSRIGDPIGGLSERDTPPTRSNAPPTDLYATLAKLNRVGWLEKTYLGTIGIQFGSGGCGLRFKSIPRTP